MGVKAPDSKQMFISACRPELSCCGADFASGGNGPGDEAAAAKTAERGGRMAGKE